MANLETLELTISANAESASKGLASLIGSLSSLGGQVNRNVGALKALNAEIAKLKGVGSIKMPNVASQKAVAEAKKTANIIKNQQEQIIPPSTPYTKYGMTAERWGSMSQAEQKTFEKQIRMQYRMQQEALNTKKVMQETAPAIQEVKTATAELAKTEKEVAPAMEDNGVKQKSFRQGFRDLAKDISSSIPKFKMLHRVLRIGTTMLIRMGIRGLLKGVKEGLGNYYQYAKATGGEFTREIDGLTSAWTQLKNQMGAAIAPAIGAVIPILNGIASAAIGAFNALSQLFALLGGKGVWSKATAQVTAFDAAAQKAGGGGGGLKEMLAKFDELNVIAQEGGGGGGGGTSAEEFATMFEDMYEFDGRIRAVAETIREIVGWLKDNMDIVLATVELIGVAILGWKVSKAFEGILGELGKIIAGGALITVGVMLGFDFGRKLGSGDVSAMDIAEGIGGLIAAAIGGSIIGGTKGLVIGVGITLVATVVGFAMSKINRSNWGDLELSAEEVKEYARSKFKVDITLEAEIMKTHISNMARAKATLWASILQFEQSLRKVHIGIDTTESGLANAKKSLDKIKDDLNAYLSAGENMLTAYLQIMPYDEKDENNILKNVFESNKILSEYIDTKGKEVADLFDKGMRNQWKSNEQTQIKALMDHINNIYTAMTTASTTAKAKSALKISMDSLSNFTQESAVKVLNKQKEIIDDFKKTMEESVIEQEAQLRGLAAAAEAAGMHELAEQYNTDAQKLVDGFHDALAKRLSEIKEPARQDWVKTLRDVYGTDFDRNFTQLKIFGSNFKSAVDKGADEASKYLKKMMEDAIRRNPVMEKAVDLFGITGWELLGDNIKKMFVQETQKALGKDAIAVLKNSLSVPINDIIKFYGYDTMSTKEKLNFVNALTKAYGAQEALIAAKNAGINVAEAINSGLSGRNAGAKAAANELVNTINSELKSRNITLDVGANVEVKIDAIVDITPNVINNTGKTISTASQSAKASAGGIAATISRAFKADGAFGLRSGDVFIANESGAELVGSIGGKTSVANQGQIIEGIQRGVAEANESQNALLRQQNDLLRGILEKEMNVNLGASASFGRTVRQSLDMYNGMTGSR